VAIDAGVIDLGISRTGFALALKAAVVRQDRAGYLSVLTVGPRVKFVAPDNRAELLRYVGLHLTEEEFFGLFQCFRGSSVAGYVCVWWVW